MEYAQNMTEQDAQQIMEDPRFQALQLSQVVSASIVKTADMCFDICVHRTDKTLSSGQEQCLKNCVERFQEASQKLTQQFQVRMQQSLAKRGYTG